MSNKDYSEIFKTQADFKRKQGDGFDVLPMTGDDVSDILQLAIDTAQRQGITRYEDTGRGLEAFMQRSIQYFEFIKQQNESADSEGSARLIPSIESWSVFMGLSRMAILTYEKQRGDDWKDAIAYIKGAIQACRSQLADRNKIPVIAHIFSAVNSLSGYANTSEIKVTAIPEKEEKHISTETPEEIATRYRSRLADLNADSLAQND